ncbi:MAG: sulfatase-like hydrolase/transferase, partial [Verrucomicrobiae bacterium]|nr:sulfatase-like hydrolase/transferase [Verrucomicrobiae bacterium]
RQGKAEPWFLYLAYNAPHTPIQPKPEWVAKVKAREPGIADRRAKLVALIEHMDEGIGKVLGCLKAIGAEENTLVLFVSDNGGQVDVGANNGPLRGAKQDMYEGGIRVPMIARWPGKIAAGAESAFEAMTMDLFATALDAAGAAAPANLDGRSILPTLTGQPQEAFARDMFWTRREGNLRYMGEVTWAMRRGPWKLVKNSPFAPWELFNLADDPQEENDL